MRKINKIIIHCTATQEGRKTTVEEITAWHKARGFKTIGYHYVIHLDGTISTGRLEEEIGAHCKGQNTNSIGIAYIGGLDKNGTPKDTRTDAQKKSMVELIKLLKNTYDVSIHGHNEYANKACPCFDVFEWLKTVDL